MLTFFYSSMNAGKTTMLLGSAHNYEERDKKILLLNSSFDTRFGINLIKSRTGICKTSISYSKKDDLKAMIQSSMPVECVFIDEAQFLTTEQVWQIVHFIKENNIPVKCYGLRTDFSGELFEGSKMLLGLADELVHVKTICGCNKHATMNNLKNKKVMDQVQIGGNDMYESLCINCWIDKNTINTE